jgi:hypothetical protein
MIKLLLFILLITNTVFSGVADDGMYKGLTKSEKKFVKNIETIQQEHIVSITKQSSSYILIVFPTAKYLLNSSTGFVANMWVLSDDDLTWEEMGPEY